MMTELFQLLDPLTERERDVLQLMAQGLSDRLIAETLVLSVETVRWYNRQIYSKMGVNSRTQASIRARDLALLDPQTPFVSTPPALNLPAYTTPFIGRAAELHELNRMLADAIVRVISVVGSGGVGKTRLCVEVARTQLDNFPDGIYFIEPGNVTRDDFVDVLCHTLFVPLDENNHLDALLTRLVPRRLLLVLDNFEQFLNQAGLLIQLLKAAPQLKILVSSQISLNLNNEWVCRIEGLPVSNMARQTPFEISDAVALLAACVQRVRRQFSMDEHMDCMVDICDLVYGNPLAIELAAGWLKTLSCHDVVSEIRRNIDFLATTAPDMEERHRSLRAAFTYAWALLTPDEQRMFKRLAVFRGEFGSEAASQVSGIAIQVLSSLVDRSLVRQTSTGRYELHPLLRQYAEEQLTASPTSQSSRLPYALTSILNGNLEDLTAFTENSRAEEEDALLFDRSLSLAAFGIVAAVSEDYERGIQCCSASLARPGRPIHLFLAHLGLAMAYCGLNRYSHAQKHLLLILKQASLLESEAFMMLCLPIGALWTAHQADPQRALSMIALALSPRASLPQWMQKWRIFSDLRRELEQELEPDSSHRTWMAGEALDLSQTVHSLLNELDASDHK
jgi:predicted ATPase/DNA-binding CsgD family transcriptional regulator